MCTPGQDAVREPAVQRLAFDNIYKLNRRFPLLEGQEFLIPALLDLLRYQQVTPLFIDHVPGVRPGDPSLDPGLHLSTFDNVLHLFLQEEHGSHRPYMRILKSVGNEFDSQPFPVTL
jgi:hypothetical protein